jgi:hypothetical protein
MKSIMAHHSRFPVFHLFFLLLGGLALHAADVLDPFASGAPSWTDQIAAQKPYRLQIACAEIATTQPSAPAPAKPLHADALVTAEFLKAAKITTIAVAANDSGNVGREDGVEITYKIERKGTEFALTFNLKSKGAEGRREINTDLVLIESTWCGMGGLEREQVTTYKDGSTTSSRLSFIIALRIDPATP